MREHSRSRRRRYSFYVKDVERHRREKVDRWALRLDMIEWLRAFSSYGDDWDDDYWDDVEYECAWADPGWSVTFLDLMR